MTLYVLSHEIRALLDQSEDGELSDELMAQLDALLPSLSHKVDAYCALIREAKARNVARQAEIDRLKAAMATDGNLEDRLKDRLHDALVAMGTRDHQTPRFKVWVQKSPPSITCTAVTDELPAEYKRVKVEPDCKAALEHWKTTGEAPTGFIIRADDTHLRIK